MKKSIVVSIAAMFLVGVMMVSGAWAASVNATAIVQKKCTAVSGGSFDAFNIDPDSAKIDLKTSANGTSPTIRCTKGTVVTTTCSPAVGSNGVLSSATDPGGDITYSVTACPNVTALGYGTDNPIDIEISIAANAAQNSAAGNHIGTITVTVGY